MKKLFSAVAMLALLTTPVLAADPAPKADQDVVVAKINGKALTRADLIKEAQMLGPQAAMMQPGQLIDNIVASRLASEAGYAKGLQDDAEVKAAVKHAEAQIVARAYVVQAVKPQLTEEKVKARYDRFVKEEFKAQDEIRARHILVPTEDEAKALIAELKKGGDFAKLAMEKSKDSGSAKQGGDLGYFPKGEMVPEFAKAAFAMKTGAISDKPVKTSFGWHVIKVEDKRKSAPPAFDAVRDQVQGRLGAEMSEDMIKKMVRDAKVEKFNLDGSPMTAKADKK